jgi:hypothetical protein
MIAIRSIIEIKNRENMAEKAPEKAMDKKQEIAQKIQDSDNILITVNSDPSVDELATALGLTLLVNDMGKHGTAIASGKIPDALEFLSPDKTFEDNVDSLRDFIIALNKDKADHLRYKIEGDFVKVFITPYRTTISEKDLEFSRGDYNVDLVVALNVKTNDDLDHALQAHGKILHDATVMDITTDERIGMGDLTWSDPGASSLAEMVVDMVSDFKIEGGTDSLMDQSIATAFLTGIVASTNRFSNEKTSASTMAAAAKLMKQGADQQLVISNLDKFKDVFSDDLKDEGGSKEAKPKSSSKKSKKPSNELSIDHSGESETEGGSEEPVSAEAPAPAEGGSGELQPTVDIVAEREAEAAKLAEQRLAEGLAAVGGGAPAGSSALDDLQKETDTITQAEPTVGPPPAVPQEELHGAVANWEHHILPSDSGGPSDGSTGMSPDTEEPSVPSIEDTAGPSAQGQDGYLVSQPGAPAADQPGANIFGSALTPEQLAETSGAEQPASVEPTPQAEPPEPEPVDMSGSPFVPPVPPPPAPDFNTGTLPMPPGIPDMPIALPVAEPIPEPVPVPSPVVEPQPIPAPSAVPAPSSVPEGSVFENNNQVMPDQVYPPAAQGSDIGQFRIPGQ